MIRFNNSQKNGGFLLKIFHVHTHMTKMLRHDLARAFEMDFVLEHNTSINTSYSFIFNIISMFSLDTIGIFVLKINTRNKSSQEKLMLVTLLYDDDHHYHEFDDMQCIYEINYEHFHIRLQ